MPVTFTMSKEDSDLVLEHVPDLDEATRARLRFGLAEGHRLRYTLSDEQFDDLLDSIDDAACLAGRRKVQRMLGNILEKLEAYLAEPDEEDDEWEVKQWEEGDDPDFTAPWLAPLKEQVFGILERMRGASEEVILAATNKALAEFNDKPNEEMAGYTPNQLKTLTEATLGSPDCPVQCRADVSLDQLGASWAFQDMRLLLRLLAEEGGTKTTSSGSLNRAFVRRFVDEMLKISTFYDGIVPDKKVLNEHDIGNLAVTHRVAHEMALVVLSGNNICLTKRGAHMLEDARAGELFRDLFIRSWHDLDRGDNEDTAPIDDLIAFALCMLHGLGKHARGDLSFDEVAEKVIPRMLVRMLGEEIDDPMFMLKLILYSRVFSPLNDFGLASARKLSDADEDTPLPSQMAVFVTPLFDAFFSFNFEKSTGPLP